MDECRDTNPECGHCGMHGLCNIRPGDSTGAPASTEPVEGLAAASFIVFLVPLAAGIGGAFAAARLFATEAAASQNKWYLLGLIAGAGVGLVLAKCAVWLWRPVRTGPGGGKE